GQQPVMVRNANGPAATASSVEVTRVAPAIYYGPEGGVLTNLDYRLIGENNPARPGGLVWLFGTGFGAVGARSGAPALTTGDIPAPGRLYDTGPVIATIGGRDARVLESLQSPG